MKKRNIKYVNNRILEISEDHKQITLPDSRYYRRNGEYYPSRFVDFWETQKPELIDQEIHLYSDTLKVAGTTDLVCKIGNDLWIIDHKTSNHIQTTHELQAAVYAHCYEECFGIKPDKPGILWLKSSKRKGSKDKMQGKGWEMVLPARTQEENIEIFKTVKRLFDLENPTHAPIFTEFKTTVKRDLAI